MRVLDVKGNTEAEIEVSGKCKGHITASIAAPLHRAWQIGSDFSGLQKFVPIVEVCERLKGCNRTPGCLRFYTMNSATGLPGGKRKAWAKDCLLNIDEETHSYTYAVEGSNMHLENCQISFTASGGKDGTTIVKWAWELDPVKKCTTEKTLSDMSDFGCTFIKGLEAAAAATAEDSIDFDFEGAPLDTLCGNNNDDDGEVGEESPPPPVLSLMKSRLETLTDSLNRISQKLEDGPLPPDLYCNELESLQATLAEGRRSLVSHMNAYMSESEPTHEASGKIAESYEVDCISSTTEKVCSSSTERMNNPPQDYVTRSVADSETCRRKCLDAISRMYLPDGGKACRGGGSRALDRGGHCGQASGPALFPPLASKEEDLRLEMEEASRGAYEAFRDFSNQFHRELRDDIVHQLESVGARLESISAAGRRDGPACCDTEGDGFGVCSRSNVTVVGHKSHPHTPRQEDSPHPRWSPQVAKMSPAPLGCQPNEYDDSNRHHGQFGDWEPEELQNRRLQGSPKLPSLRFRSGLLFRDLLQEEMSQDQAAAHHEPEAAPETFQLTNSSRGLKVALGCVPCCRNPSMGAQRSPPACNRSGSPKVTNVPIEYQLSQSQASEARRFRKTPPLQDGDCHIERMLEAKYRQYIDELETKGHDQGLEIDHHSSELSRTNEDRMLPDSSSSSREIQSFEDSGEGFEELRDSPDSWKHRVSKVCRTSQNLEADLSRLQIFESEKQREDGPHVSESGEFHGYNQFPRPSRLPVDIWPDFRQGDSNLENGLDRDRHGEDIYIRECTGKDEFQFCPTTQTTRAIVLELASTSSSSLSCQSSKNYKKFLHLNSLPPRCSPCGEPVAQPVAAGLKTAPPFSKLEEISSTIGSGGVSNTAGPGVPSGALDQQQSDCPLSALSSSGQCAQHVMLDLTNEIAPGVFHSRQGKQTRLIIDIPEDLEARETGRRHLRSLLRKAEIYKEFALLGIQKPPTEEQLLADFASARHKKQQPAVSEAEAPWNHFPPYQPYYAEGKVFPPDAGPSPTHFKDPFSEEPQSSNGFTGAPSHLTKAKSSGPSAEGQTQSSKSIPSRRKPPTGRIVESRPQFEQQMNNVTSSFQQDEIQTTSEGGLRGETTAREMAVGGDSNRARKPPRGGLTGYPSSYQPRRSQTVEGSTLPHGLPLQQKRDIKGTGRTAPHVPAFSSKAMAKTQTEVSGLTESPHVQPSTSQGTEKPKIGISSLTECPPHHSMTCSQDPFPPHEGLNEELEHHAEIRPEIRIYTQDSKNLLKINTPAFAIHAHAPRQSGDTTPRSSSEGSMAKILINFPSESGDTRLLELTHYRPPTSQQGSVDAVVNNLPSGSGSSEFDPYRIAGKWGSVNGSSGSDSSYGLSFSRQLHIGDVLQHTIPKAEKPPTLTDVQSNFLTLLHFDESDKQPNFIDSLMYPPDDSLADRQRTGPPGSCQDCPFRQLKQVVDEAIQSSEPGSPRCLPHELTNSGISRGGQYPLRPPLSRMRSEGEDSIGAVASSSSRKPHALTEILNGMPPALKGWKNGSAQPTWSHKLDEVSRQLDAKAPKPSRDAQTQTDMESEGEGLQTAQGTQVLDSVATRGTQIAIDKEPDEGGALRARQYSQILNSMDRSAAELTDDPKAHTEKVDAMVTQTGDVGLISSWNAKKKRRAEKLAFQTRSTLTMLNSAINVREFTDDSRSYSIWLDGLAPGKDREVKSGQDSNEAAEQTPPASDASRRSSQDSETQTSRNVSDHSVENSRENQHCTPEPRFREDSAANFLGTVASQILHEFGDSQKPEGTAEDKPGGHREPSFREESAANFLGTLSKQIVHEFTDYTSNRSHTLDQTEGQKERRFREKSALKFLEDLSEQLLPEMKSRRGSSSLADTYGDLRDQRFREGSAINFLGALRDLVMQRNPPDSITAALNTANQSLQSEASQSSLPSRYPEAMKASANQASHTEDFNYQPGPGNQGHLTGVGDDQFDSQNQAYPTESWNYQPDAEIQPFPEEGFGNQSEAGIQPYPDERLGDPPDAGGHPYPDERLGDQPDAGGHPYPDEGLGDQPDAGGHPYPDEGLGYQPDAGGHPYLDEGGGYQPDAGGRPYADEGLGFQPDAGGHPYPDEVFGYLPDAERHPYPDEGLGYQTDAGGHPYPDEGLGYQPEEQSPGSGAEGPSYHQPESEGQPFPDGFSYQHSGSDEMIGTNSQSETSQIMPPKFSEDQKTSEGASNLTEDLNYPPGKPENQAYQEGLSYQPESEGQGSPDGGLSYQPESDGQGSPDGGLSYQPESEGQGSRDEGSSYQPESEGQGSSDGALSHQPDSEGHSNPGDPVSEGEPDPEDVVNYQPDAEGPANSDESVNSLTHESTDTTTDQGSQNQTQNGRAGRRNSQFGVGGPRSSQRNSQVAVLNEMLQDLHATVSRSRQNSASNPGANNPKNTQDAGAPDVNTGICQEGDLGSASHTTHWLKEMTRSSTTSMSLMPALQGLQFDAELDFEHEFRAATAHIPKTSDFECADFDLEGDSKQLELKGQLCLPIAHSFADFGAMNQDPYELMQLEAEVGSLGF